MAKQRHLEILKQGVDVWNQWLKKNPLVKLDLSHAKLHGINLSEANLNQADLRGVDLRGADLSAADLNQADLRGADLSITDLLGARLRGTDLSHVNLRGANLRGADLSQAKLRGADLRDANLSYTALSHADLAFINIGWTVFSNVDLSETTGIDTITHEGPSSISIDTITQSKGKIPEIFLKGAGVPDIFITYMESLTNEPFQYYSCFISHSSKDKIFVERLYADLQAKGVRCWYAPRDLTIGEPILLGIEKGIRLHEKLLLVFSEHSVNSNWVQHETLSAMTREQGKEPWVLFPIRIDDSVMQPNVLWADMIKRTRHIGDFTNWKDHDTYQQAFDQLLRDLKQGKGE